MSPSRGEAWFLHLSTVLVGGTGLVYAWMRYLAEPTDPFAVVNHPWQPELRFLHLLTAPLLVFGLGLLWSAHAWARLRAGRRRGRATGLGAMVLAAPMIASGYLLQGAVEESWRTVWIVVHLVASGAWLAAYAAHLPRLRRCGAGNDPQGRAGGGTGERERGKTGPSLESTVSRRRVV